MHSAFFLLPFPPLKNRASLIGPICHRPVNRFARFRRSLISCRAPHFNTGWHVPLPAFRSKALISHGKSVHKHKGAYLYAGLSPYVALQLVLRTSGKLSHIPECSQLIRRVGLHGNSPGIIDLEVSNGNDRSLSSNPREILQQRG